MPGITVVQRGLKVMLLVGVGCVLARRAELALHPYPPLAAWGSLPPQLLDPSIQLAKAIVTRCRAVLAPALLLAAFGVAGEVLLPALNRGQPNAAEP